MEKNLVSVDNYEKPVTIILDIETKPQEDLIPLCEDELKPSGVLKDPEKIKADIEAKKLRLKKKMSVDPDFADIRCICIKSNIPDAQPIVMTPKELEQVFEKYPFAKFVTFNGKGFDIPLLIKYGLKHGLNYPYRELREMCIKWRGEKHIDLMELICDREYKSLDLLLQIYLGIKKTPIDFETANEEEIKAHCIEDVLNTEKLYNLFKKII